MLLLHDACPVMVAFYRERYGEQETIRALHSIAYQRIRRMLWPFLRDPVTKVVEVCLPTFLGPQVWA
jgi:hypothetical protein